VTEYEWEDDQEISMFALGTTVLRNRWRIIAWMVVGGILATAWAFLKAPVYTASASFAPQVQNSDASRTGMATIAGQFGLALSPGNQTTSPEFYASLLKSRVLLETIARDTLVVPEEGGRKVAMLDLMTIPKGPQKLREEKATKRLREIVESSVVRTTGVVQLSVMTRWPSVSLAIANALVGGVNEYNQRSRQGQAAAERKFLEGRVAVASGDLRLSEDRLEEFLRNNREFRASPDLTVQYERMQRDVSFRQQVFTSLTQSYEEARMREVRDTPLITVIEPPAVPALPESRGVVKHILLGIVLAGFFAVVFIVVSESFTRRSNAGGADAAVFARAVAEVKSDLFERLPWIRRQRS
jgi:tyrosine-protein kinase Etk/Wzc